MTFAVAASPRWHGERDRVEVWYSTLTDPATGTGVWIHYETVAPIEGGAEPYAHGWIAVFPPDAEPVCERFGPISGISPPSGAVWFDAPGGRIDASHMTGATESISWKVVWADASPPLFTFPQIAWEREVLPGAQVLPVPTARFSGTITLADRSIDVAEARGNIAHIYGHGNAKRWGWFHGDLGGGDVLEIVSGVSRTKGLSLLPPTAFARLRVDGVDWPRGPLPSFRMNTELALPDWKVVGSSGMRRLSVLVHQPPDRSVALTYVDPDGETATCTNSCVADALITLEKRGRGGWQTEREWNLEGTAHAEIGTRP